MRKKSSNQIFSTTTEPKNIHTNTYPFLRKASPVADGTKHHNRILYDKRTVSPFECERPKHGFQEAASMELLIGDKMTRKEPQRHHYSDADDAEKVLQVFPNPPLRIGASQNAGAYIQ